MRELQRTIIDTLGAKPHLDPGAEVERAHANGEDSISPARPHR
ncbi:hypothetical protein [Dietzia sp. ANT_WB102]|nr:hypothetical protein [Dietzia sp. ANT_WB102]